MVNKNKVYRVIFNNLGKGYEIYAKSVSQSDMAGFVVVEDLLFGDRNAIVVDPSEERLRTEFHDVKRFFVPIYSIARIDEVQKEGNAKIVEFKTKGQEVYAHIKFPTED